MASCPECENDKAAVLPGTEGWFVYCSRCGNGWAVDGRGVRHATPRTAEHTRNLDVNLAGATAAEWRIPGR